MKDLIELEKERLEWSLKNFPDATPESSLRKLIGEAYEAIEETKFLKLNIPALSEEYADCLMCLLDSAGRAGISVEKVIEAFAKKLDKNKARVWKKNPDNTYSHVKVTREDMLNHGAY